MTKLVSLSPRPQLCLLGAKRVHHAPCEPLALHSRAHAAKGAAPLVGAARARLPCLLLPPLLQYPLVRLLRRHLCEHPCRLLYVAHHRRRDRIERLLELLLRWAEQLLQPGEQHHRPLVCLTRELLRAQLVNTLSSAALCLHERLLRLRARLLRLREGQLRLVTLALRPAQRVAPAHDRALVVERPLGRLSRVLLLLGHGHLARTLPFQRLDACQLRTEQCRLRTLALCPCLLGLGLGTHLAQLLILCRFKPLDLLLPLLLRPGQLDIHQLPQFVQTFLSLAGLGVGSIELSVMQQEGWC